MKELLFIACMAIYSSNILAQSADTTTISIQATAQEICAEEQVTLSVRKTCAIGDILCTDGTTVKREEFTKSNKTAKGVVFWISPDETHGWAIHPQEVVREWAMTEGDILGLPNIDCETLTPETADTAGYQNTQIIRGYGTADEFPAAYAVDFEQGFYLPAAGQVLLMITKMLELNNSLAIVPGANQMNEEIVYKEHRTYELVYWASTEMDKKYAIYGCTLRYRYTLKTMYNRVRGVCSFEINKK